MSRYFLTLKPFRKMAFKLELFEGIAQDEIDEAHPLIGDLSYEFELNIPDAAKIFMYVNGEAADLRGGKVFLDCYGYARLDFFIEMKSGAQLNLSTKYLPVLVKNAEFNCAVQKMVQYIYDNCAELPFDADLKSKDKLGLNENRRTLTDRIALAKNIAAVYEQSYSYFKTNCRFKTEKIPALERFEKLQCITPLTLQYVAAHPENLSQVGGAGIRVGNRVFQPHKTLLVKNNPSRDTCENKIVLWFLHKVREDLSALSAGCESRLNKSCLTQKNFGSQYEYSPYHVFFPINSFLTMARVEIAALREKFNRLVQMYSEILPLAQDKFILPQPTPIFLSVPQYNRIFIQIHEWLKCGAYDFAKEDFMLALAKNWSLYEKYLLIKLIRRGFVRIDDADFIFSGRRWYVKIYYQPEISKNRELRLYRNNSISLEGERGQNYYNPDFVIEFKNNRNLPRYFIIDAKFSALETVKKYSVPAFVFKYIFSISPLDSEEEISGYGIIYGKTKNGMIQSVFDRRRGEIQPPFEIVPIMENADEAIHFMNFDKLFELYAR